MPRLSQLLGYGLQPEPIGSTPLTAATVVPDAGFSESWKINIGTSNGVAIAAAANPGGKLLLYIVNASGGASMVLPTLDAQYMLASNNGCIPPTVAGKQRLYSFAWDGAKYVEYARSITDI